MGQAIDGEGLDAAVAVYRPDLFDAALAPSAPDAFGASRPYFVQCSTNNKHDDGRQFC